MSSGHEHNGDAGGQHGALTTGRGRCRHRLLRREVLSAWRTRALIVAVVFALLSLPFAFTHEGKNHILRAYLMGYMICFSFAGGGLVMLMLQYVSGGKWGLLLRRPLEAMTRTIWLVGLMFVPIIFLDEASVSVGAVSDLRRDRRMRLQALAQSRWSRR